MRHRSSIHLGRDVALATAVFVAVFVAAMIAVDGGFAITLAVIIVLVAAMFVPLAFIIAEEHDLPFHGRRRL